MYRIELEFGVLAIHGLDRQKFLHNFCTANVQRMVPGQIHEAFVLNTKGKLVGHVHVWCFPERIELFSWPSQTLALREHLVNYVIREKVSFEAAADQQGEFFFASGGVESPSEILGSQIPVNTFQQWLDVHGNLQIARGDFCGPGWLVRADAGISINAIEFKQIRDVPPADRSQLDLHRIGHHYPCFGIDADHETLPQELQRDRQAISFDKGCYLGQETVARIDALGHVNRILVQVRLERQPTETLPTQLRLESSVVGTLTSLALDPSDNHWIGLATVKRTNAKPGVVLDAGGVQAEIRF